MSIAEFEIPDFLKGQSRDEIHARMLEMMPDEWDKSEGQFPYEFTIPTASEIGELSEYTLIEAIKSIFPMWANNDMLDYHAQTRGITRKSALQASGKIIVTGINGTKIPKGYTFTTASTYDKPGISFETTENAVIENDSVEICVKALTSGIEGNVAANSVILMNKPMVGITSIINPTPMSGGTEEETDDALRSRVIEFDYHQGAQFIGCMADYKRWALEVQGVGAVQVKSATDDSGLVTLIITDTEGNPATQDICTNVYNHIMRPDNPELRSAPINAFLQVIPPTSVRIAIQATAILDGTTSINDIKSSLHSALKLYYKEAQNEIRWTHVGSALLECQGVKDYTTLTLNGEDENILIDVGQMAITDKADITISEG